MGRKPRKEFDGALYHAIQRGNNKEFIFSDDLYKEYLIKKLTQFKVEMNFELYGYVIMSNHYHLLIRSHEIGLSSLMHRLNSDFSKYYNFKNNRTGHVFQERYKGILVYDDNYLASLLRYIHQNPVKANICKYVYNYKWSSDLIYRKNLKNKLVDTDSILNKISPNRKMSIEKYIKFMDSSELEDSAVFENVNIIGEVNESVNKIQRQSLDNILREAVNNNEKLFDLIKNASRKRNLTEFKQSYIRKALSVNYSRSEIGRNIGISNAAVCLLLNR